MACNRHKKREGGSVVPVFRGVAERVEAILRKMSHISSIRCGKVRKYYGHQKVKIMPWCAGPEPLVIVACDKEGEFEMLVSTTHKGARLRMLRRELGKCHISVNAPDKKCAYEVAEKVVDTRSAHVHIGAAGWREKRRIGTLGSQFFQEKADDKKTDPGHSCQA